MSPNRQAHLVPVRWDDDVQAPVRQNGAESPNCWAPVRQDEDGYEPESRDGWEPATPDGWEPESPNGWESATPDGWEPESPSVWASARQDGATA